MKLMSFQYEAYHIAGVDNVWADLLSRWLEKPEATRSIKRSTRDPTFVADQYSHIDPLGVGQMDMPTSEAIKNMQALYTRDGVSDITLCVTTGLRMRGCLVWIPSQDVEMTTRIMIVYHRASWLKSLVCPFERKILDSQTSREV
jgi:hypothetical protein